MPISNDILRLTRAIDELTRAIAIGASTGKGMSAAERQATRAEIEQCMQRLDELRGRLSTAR